jgi:predicted nucleic acid-binding protein
MIYLIGGLGKGETSVIGVAMQNPELIAILDDGKARKCAKLYNIKITGTIGLMFIAKELGLINSLIDTVTLLKKEGLYISEKLMQSILHNE